MLLSSMFVSRCHHASHGKTYLVQGVTRATDVGVVSDPVTLNSSFLELSPSLPSVSFLAFTSDHPARSQPYPSRIG